mmetsp:Transcript_25246/g.54571  ORF Transcript_25246/g.54571 Transcript_25246/m.54571 type:complete len:236 (-) Transcript_25246:221-928(-)
MIHAPLGFEAEWWCSTHLPVEFDTTEDELVALSQSQPSSSLTGSKKRPTNPVAWAPGIHSSAIGLGDSGERLGACVKRLRVSSVPTRRPKVIPALIPRMPTPPTYERTAADGDWNAVRLPYRPVEVLFKSLFHQMCGSSGVGARPASRAACSSCDQLDDRTSTPPMLRYSPWALSGDTSASSSRSVSPVSAAARTICRSFNLSTPVPTAPQRSKCQSEQVRQTQCASGTSRHHAR